ncbi:hypothetical protein RBB77_02320 [Tunturibacter psychrotolerans]|uniref:Carboxypeptidase regulatory-like domain-containing protein n=1 Tax=Tunturiibacter psychrotolerans TaxID=3069686 RepID=A0AAU7ZRZ0_9BACT
MEVQIFRTLGGIAGLAGLAIGMILFLYREILRKNVFPTLTKRDAYRLLRNIAILSWSIAMFGILGWAWSTAILHRSQPAPDGVAAAPDEALVIAGTVVDQSTNMGIGQATIVIDGQSSSFTSEDTGNFRIALPGINRDPVRLSVTKNGYFKVDQSVIPPTHALILQMRPK